jgi:hypothetical protein
VRLSAKPEWLKELHMSRFWQQPRQLVFNEEFHTRFNPSSHLTRPELVTILHRALQNDPSDVVLRRVLTNVCGLNLSQISTSQLAELKTIILASEEKPVSVVVECDIDARLQRSGVYKPLPTIITRCREWASNHGMETAPLESHDPVNDPETPDEFTRYERQAQNSNRMIGENEEPEWSEDEVTNDIEEEDDDE